MCYISNLINITNLGLVLGAQSKYWLLPLICGKNNLETQWITWESSGFKIQITDIQFKASSFIEQFLWKNSDF